MDISVHIDDSRVTSFSPEAQNSLKQACADYASTIIDEAKRIEQNDRISATQAEVIASHIDEAKKNYRRPVSAPKWKIAVDIAVELLLLFVGGLFDRELLLKDNLFLIFYVVLIIVTVVLLVLKYAHSEHT